MRPLADTSGIGGGTAGARSPRSDAHRAGALGASRGLGSRTTNALRAAVGSSVTSPPWASRDGADDREAEAGRGAAVAGGGDEALEDPRAQLGRDARARRPRRRSTRVVAVGVRRSRVIAVPGRRVVDRVLDQVERQAVELVAGAARRSRRSRRRRRARARRRAPAPRRRRRARSGRGRAAASRARGRCPSARAAAGRRPGGASAAPSAARRRRPRSCSPRSSSGRAARGSRARSSAACAARARRRRRTRAGGAARPRSPRARSRAPRASPRTSRASSATSSSDCAAGGRSAPGRRCARSRAPSR